MQLIASKSTQMFFKRYSPPWNLFVTFIHETMVKKHEGQKQNYVLWFIITSTLTAT